VRIQVRVKVKYLFKTMLGMAVSDPKFTIELHPFRANPGFRLMADADLCTRKA
jgi:hypothetical protein